MILKNKQFGSADKYLLSIIPVLIVFGLIMLFSASLATSQSNFGDPYHYIKGQLFGLFIGLIFFFFSFRIDYHIFKKYSFLFLITSLCLSWLGFVKIATKTITPTIASIR